jgi:hypothetical protein
MTESRINKKRALVKELKGVLVFLIAFAILSTLAGGAIALDEVLSNQHSGHITLNQVNTAVTNTNKIIQFIEDCTNPKGTCYKEGQAAQVIQNGKIEDIVVLAAACAKQPQNVSVPEIRACVDAQLK